MFGHDTMVGHDTMIGPNIVQMVISYVARVSYPRPWLGKITMAGHDMMGGQGHDDRDDRKITMVGLDSTGGHDTMIGHSV